MGLTSERANQLEEHGKEELPKMISETSHTSIVQLGLIVQKKTLIF